MKKVAIVTLNGYFNYGNRLQNYAVQEVLKSYGYSVETIIVDTKKSQDNIGPVTTRLENIKKHSAKKIFKKIQRKIWFEFKKNEFLESKNLRTEIFKKFTLNNIKETDIIISDNTIPTSLSDRYDYFITGSDQVWNPDYIQGSSIYFLTFADRHKRIAFSPSFGVSEIKPEYVESYKKWIQDMNCLSVREDDGAKIIKRLTGRKAPVLVDPTLLIRKEQWLSIAKEASNKPEDKYLLTYFLGGVPNKYKNQIKNIARKNNLKIINLGDIREKETYRTGPSEFIDYINSCSLFCTDSFHGAVFSILFEKAFIVYERMGSSLSMFSRINTLLNKFNLNSRKVENIKTNEDVFYMDYSHVPPILEAERKKALNYLENALKIKDIN